LSSAHRAADDNDDGRASDLLALSGELLVAHGRQPNAFGGGRGERESLSQLTIENDKFPRPQATVVRRMRGGTQYQC
jgi:hypothetical protein